MCTCNVCVWVCTQHDTHATSSSFVLLTQSLEPCRMNHPPHLLHLYILCPCLCGQRMCVYVCMRCVCASVSVCVWHVLSLTLNSTTHTHTHTHTHTRTPYVHIHVCFPTLLSPDNTSVSFLHPEIHCMFIFGPSHTFPKLNTSPPRRLTLSLPHIL